jgi:hypothetical protein
MNDPNSTENVEAFLFELNELMERHKARIEAVGYGEFQIHANGHSSPVVESYDHPNRLVLDSM